MKYQNNATKVRRLILISIAQAFYLGQLIEQIDRIPIERFPKENKGLLRCCIYKERAIVKQRIMSALGFGVEEDDELTSLAAYAKRALKRAKPVKGAILSVLDIACSGCVSSRYLITNACRGCMARPCTLNCPKQAISVVNGQSVIDYDLCVNCGRCAQVCPYKAIIKVPVPCEEACPVDAIHKDDSGKAVIDFTKCISCGQCMVACPFGAVMEKSHFIDVLQHLANADKKEQTIVAMVAPAIAGNQFAGNLNQIAAALKLLGFTRVVEVAGGADITAKVEAEEFSERMKQGDKFMTTSCCPAYAEAVAKHIPELQPMISTAKTPMHYTAEMIKNSAADAITVFVGPCIAKRKEAENNKNIDYVLTFEELDALFAARNINVTECEASELENHPSDAGRGFATTCGVTEALLDATHKDVPIHTELIDGLTKQTVKDLKRYAKNPDGCNFNFLEVMACEGGCVGGPCAIGKLQSARRAIRKIAQKQ
ncbi:MAG: monomeric [FeFe] hydrogenase [Gammaproteobacteria bacterium]|nr:monomeric [FeFe] hydrogenase [Gammaproteobacteria bacterium]